MRLCAGTCGLPLAGRTHYREVQHCWVERRSQGGANAARLVVYTGRALCALCLKDRDSDPVPKARVCDRCEEHAVPLFLEVVSCWVIVRAKGAAAHGGANALTRARYSGLAVCSRCLFGMEQGEQLELFS